MSTPSGLLVVSGRSGLTAFRRGAGLIEVNLGPALVMVGFMDPLLAAVIVERNWDLINHHRDKVIKHAGQTFSARKEAMPFVASQMFGYGRQKKGRYVATIEEATGEIFASGEKMKTLEEGGTVQAAKPMAIPIEAITMSGTKRLIAMRAFRKKLKEGGYFITDSGAIVAKNFDDQGLRGKMKEGSNKYVRIIGFMRRQRRARRLLRFMDIFEEIAPKHMAKFDRDIDLAMTNAGRKTLSNRYAANSNGRGPSRANVRAVYKEAYEAEIAASKDVALAQKIAREAVSRLSNTQGNKASRKRWRQA